MKTVLSILLMAFIFPVYAQETKPIVVDSTTYHTTTLQWLDNISWEDVKEGFVKRSPSYHGRYAFDSAFTYKEYDYDCIATFVTNQGKWKIDNKNKVVIKSKSGNAVFRLAQVANCRFLIPVDKVGPFTKDLRVALTKIKKQYSARIISLSLMLRLSKRYFCRAS